MSSNSIKTICFCSLCAIAAASGSVQDQHPQLTTTSILRRSLQTTTTTTNTTFVNLYEPITNVDASALIDKDVRTIFSKTALETHEAFQEAQQIYSQGAYAGSYATLRIDALSLIASSSLIQGTVVQGASSTGNSSGDLVVGFVMETAPAGNATSLQVQYMTDCHVGGLKSPVLDHCFAESNGDQTIQLGENGPTIAYTYNQLQDTRNALTLESMGRGNSSSPTYTPFSEYSGAYDYANQVNLAAFQGSKTAFPNNSSNLDFSNFDKEGRAAFLRWGVVGMNVHSQILDLLHHATGACLDDENAIHHWDEAVALYTGSITDFPGEEGYLLFTVAEIECPYFGTCSEGDMAGANEQIFTAFLQGRQYLKNKQCQELVESSNDIKSLMMIPLVQRVLRHAYELDKEENRQLQTQGEAAAFMASLAPHLYACQRSSARMVWNDLAPGKAPGASFEVLKFNLERAYDCLGIQCADVGGLLHIDPLSSGQKYYTGAEPCDYVPSASNSVNNETAATETATTLAHNDEKGNTVMIVVLIALGILVAIVAATAIRCRSKQLPAKTLDNEPIVDVDMAAIKEREDVITAVEVGEIA